MAKRDKTPDKVTHSSEFVIAPKLSPWLEKTVIRKGGKTYTGYGWTREEADKNAGAKYRKGTKD
jgi:hypothetical protein